jgi:hypothetical protein
MSAFLCDEPFEFGQPIYCGKRVPAWDIMVCNDCLAANHDGIVPEAYPHLAKHLEVRDLQNAEGWILCRQLGHYWHGPLD